ncbi:MAG: DUF3231 family protein [Bacillota bacterium]
MESNHDPIKLTSSEVAKLWGSYLNDSLGNCTISHFLKDVEDPDIREVLEYASDISTRHGANIMIDNGWLEKPPSAPDRKKWARG